MGPSRAAVSATVLLFVSLSSACKDEHDCLQTEVSFADIMQGFPEMQQPDGGMEQKEVDLGDLFAPDELPVIEQRMVFPPLKRGHSAPGLDLRPMGRPPSFGPRSFGGLPLDYPVRFPPGRPTPNNIQAICVHGNHRPRYPDSYFPPSYFSKQKRKAAAVNNAESWFDSCCKMNQTLGVEGTLCCATLAWEHSVKLFCEEDSSVKDRLYECCRKRGDKRLNCFSKDSPNPNYEATEELPVEPVRASAEFHFKLSDCSRNQMTPLSLRATETTEEIPSTSQNADIHFPPGRPSADNIDSVCANQKLRPLYTTKCLSHSGNELLARQVKTINRLEKGFKRCCKQKNGASACADKKWREEMNKYCSAQKGDQADFHCCRGKKVTDRYSCFQTSSPDPHYNRTSATEEISFDKICDFHNIIKTRFPGFALEPFVEQCCPLPGENKNNCLEQKLEETSQNLCSSNKTPSPAVRRCCKIQSREGIPQCLSKVVMDAITRATRVQTQKKKKICPIP
ncbi:extracellular matrix protein 1 [Nematolebias whitei]|uniref:extracellular matrix protein 1 n=1 Tax=Nematolebias whitei TaxID=451745 RepID=UPI00189BA729|nr:extracellular matrix protein 1 [Nematolebias whitei]